MDAFRGEWLKLRKRPAVWVLGGILVCLVVLLTYGVLFLIIVTRPGDVQAGGGGLDSLKQAIYPSNFVVAVLSGGGGGFAGAIALILGALSFGSEYSWATLKTIFTQRPARLEVFAAKALALAAVLAVYDLVIFVAGAAVSSLVGAYFGHLTPWPSLVTVFEGLLAGWLVLAVWASLGTVLSVLFRQAGLAIGLGLVYSLAVEGILFGILGQFSWIKSIERAFPGANASALIQALSTQPRSPQNPEPVVGALQAIGVLLVYLALFLALSGLTLRRRDVT
ncbi:MAG: ABC transporter permease subunit [Candidatus Dormibacteraeota bacterium]|uniref:ABC transporter permease subunit n=2 Tax=Candidatus Nephthysia bennettiae TaxID=3127016 RepID=A0A934K5I2_9BACT|nr:ABC transporter permease subunit [Candidatus Dormibacteraeota bacterium]MBJ7611058.1 ABC transporter permease subunit [Candidatus Dormibacteraeota bacterium]